MSEFIRPNVSVEEVNDRVARVTAEPLERGYGDTLGSSLRRVLLSSLEGAAVRPSRSMGCSTSSRLSRASMRTSPISF